jgi:endonuclease/exonuclease/phosphatase family metal-dependent hydrolase
MGNTYRFMAWNVGFSSRKEEFLPDEDRALEIVKFVRCCDAKIVAVDEMASRQYRSGTSFSLRECIRLNDKELSSIHFESALSLGCRNSNPYGKLPELERKFGVVRQEQGLGIWVRKPLRLRNLYSIETGAKARIEVSRPLPHPLYMGIRPRDQKEYSAGRDEEDRPVLWARIGDGEIEEIKIYFVSLHLPTPKNEEKEPPEKTLTSRQREILEKTLGLSSVKHVDQLGSKLRVYFLRHLVSQSIRIEEYWGNANSCVFVFAGDFNFEHDQASGQSEERKVLTSAGFKAAKAGGFTRPGGRFVDNIWVKGAEANEFLVDGKHQIEQSRFSEKLLKISDHFPVVADVSWCNCAAA